MVCFTQDMWFLRTDKKISSLASLAWLGKSRKMPSQSRFFLIFVALHVIDLRLGAKLDVATKNKYVFLVEDM